MSGSTPPRGWRQIVADPSVRPARLPQADSQDSTRGLVTNHQQSRADRAVVEQAARRLRDRAIADGYAGYEGKHMASAWRWCLTSSPGTCGTCTPTSGLRRYAGSACGGWWWWMSTRRTAADP